MKKKKMMKMRRRRRKKKRKETVRALNTLIVRYTPMACPYSTKTRST